MGIIRKQSIRGSIYTYIGVLLGFVTVGLLWPKFLSAEQIGMINVILAISVILVQIGSLGFTNAINRYFSLFRDKSKNHNGFVFIMLIVLLAGTLISIVLAISLRRFFIEQNSAESALLGQYYYYIIPVFTAMLFFNILDAYLRLLYDAVTGIFLQELLLRILFLILLLAYISIDFNFSRFVFLYSVIFFIPVIAITGVLISRKEFALKPSRALLSRDMVSKMVSISMYGLIGGFGVIAIANIDRIMISQMMDLHNTGVYSIAFLYGTVIIIPGRIIGKSATALISDGWKNKDQSLISTIYSKTSVNQFIIALFLFLLLWLNIGDILRIIPPEYSEGKYVIFFIALANLITMTTGASGIILATSKYYRFQAYFVFFLLILIVVTNLIFIPIYGIVGAALASALSTLIHSGARYIFLLRIFKMQPFNYRYFLVAIGSLLIYFGLKQISFDSESPYLDIIITSICCTVLFGFLVFFSKASVDINDRIRTYWSIALSLMGKLIGKK